MAALSQKQRRVLEAVDELGEQATPDEIATYTGIKATTVRSYVRRLEQSGYLQRDEYGKYRVSPSVTGTDWPATPATDAGPMLYNAPSDEEIREYHRKQQEKQAQAEKAEQPTFIIEVLTPDGSGVWFGIEPGEVKVVTPVRVKGRVREG